MKDKEKENDFGALIDDEVNDNKNKEPNYFQLAKDQEFEQLLNKEIQLENAKENAMKYTNNELASNGLGQTGYGSSQQAGIYNNFLNSLLSNQNQTSQNINNINIEEAKNQELKDQERFNNFTALLSGSNNEDEINQLFVDYGFGTMNSDGSLNLDNKPANVNDDDWVQMKAVYRQTLNELNETNSSNLPVAYTVGELRSQQYLNNSGSASSLGEKGDNGFIEETGRLFEKAENGDYQNGDVIRVENWNDQVIYLEYTDGGFKQVSRKQYEKAKTKHSLKGKGKNKFEEN